VGAITLEVPACHITLLDLLNQWSSAFHLRALPGLRLTKIPPISTKILSLWNLGQSRGLNFNHMTIYVSYIYA
jgi:hypothetical protein